MTRLAHMLARYHAARAYVAALLGCDETSAKQAQLSTLAERVASAGTSETTTRGRL